MATDATVEYDDGKWKITGKAHVLFRAEKALMNAKRKADAVFLPVTPESAHEILWLGQLFELDIKNPIKIRTDSSRFLIGQSMADKILSGSHQPKVTGFRQGRKPRPYQQTAAELLKAVNGYLLADDLGLGKTISAVTAMTDPALRPAVVVLPTHLAKQWAEKIHEFVKGFRVHEIKTMKLYELPQYRRCDRCGKFNEVAKSTRKGESLERSTTCRKCLVASNGETVGADVILISYQKLDTWAPVLSQIAKTVVFDEVHELRRADSKKYNAAHLLARSCEYRLGMSATPIMNLGGEAFNVFECVSPGAVGTKDQFRETWCNSYYFSGKEPALRDPAAFGEYLKDRNLMLRRTRAEVGRELPSHTTIVQTIDADTDAIKEIDGKAAKLAQLILTRNAAKGVQMNAAGQLESLVRQQTAIAKAPYCAAYIEMLLDSGEPVVCFGWHRMFHEIIREKLKAYKPVMYTGSETPTQKEKNRDLFVSGKTNLMLISHWSGSGLDGLQKRCATGVMGELDWAAGRMTQCIGRYHRDGQQRPCFTHYLVCDYGLDPVMSQVIQEKQEQSDGLLNHKSVGPTIDATEHIRKLALEYISRGAQ